MERSVPHILITKEFWNLCAHFLCGERQSQITAGAIVGIGEEMVGITQLFGIDPMQYRAMFLGILSLWKEISSCLVRKE